MMAHHVSAILRPGADGGAHCATTQPIANTYDHGEMILRVICSYKPGCSDQVSQSARPSSRTPTQPPIAQDLKALIWRRLVGRFIDRVGAAQPDRECDQRRCEDNQANNAWGVEPGQRRTNAPSYSEHNSKNCHDQCTLV